MKSQKPHPPPPAWLLRQASAPPSTPGSAAQDGTRPPACGGGGILQGDSQRRPQVGLKGAAGWLDGGPFPVWGDAVEQLPVS